MCRTVRRHYDQEMVNGADSKKDGHVCCGKCNNGSKPESQQPEYPQGYKPWRFGDNPREHAITDLFEQKFGPQVHPIDASGTGAKAQIVFGGNQALSVLEPDEVAAVNATIQWIGTPVGAHFLRELAQQSPEWKSLFSEIAQD